VIDTVEKVLGAPLTKTESPRRDGDPPTLIAVSDSIQRVLGWKPQYDNLELIAASTLAWERHMQQAPYEARNGAV
jgi:UDP-glucose 4-epimerase